MSLNSSRASQVTPVLVRAVGRRARRAGAALVFVLGLLVATTACGMNVQTNQPYTPGEGVNFDVPAPPNDPNTVVHVRNLLIIAHGPGEGILSGSMVTAGRDSLTEVTGNAVKLDGSPGAEFSATVDNTVTLANNALVVLTNGPLITLSSPDLAAGLDATVTLKFATAGSATMRVPVVDGAEPQYRSITPAPTPSPTATATP